MPIKATLSMPLSKKIRLYGLIEESFLRFVPSTLIKARSYNLSWLTEARRQESQSWTEKANSKQD